MDGQYMAPHGIHKQKGWFLPMSSEEFFRMVIDTLKKDSESW